MEVRCDECSRQASRAAGKDCSEHSLCTPCQRKHHCTALTVDQKLAKWRAGVGGWKDSG